jgi:hypothetical protein
VSQFTERLESQLFSPEHAARILSTAMAKTPGQYPQVDPVYADLAAEASRDSMVFLRCLDGMTNPVHRITSSEVLAVIDALPVIGLNGPIGSGKDTLAEPIEREYGFRKMSFADPLRAAGVMLFKIPLRYFNDRMLKEAPLPGLGVSPRKILQLLGTEVCRGIRDDFWAHRLSLRIASHVYGAASPDPRGPAPNGIVIADVRFQNEADYVRTRTLGALGRIRRPAVEAESRSKGSGHASEAGITGSSGDIVIVNAGSMESFVRSGVGALRGAQALSQPAPAGAELPRIQARLLEIAGGVPTSIRASTAAVRPVNEGKCEEAGEDTESGADDLLDSPGLELAESDPAPARPRLR